MFQTELCWKKHDVCFVRVDNEISICSDDRIGSQIHNLHNLLLYTSSTRGGGAHSSLQYVHM